MVQILPRVGWCENMTKKKKRVDLNSIIHQLTRYIIRLSKFEENMRTTMMAINVVLLSVIFVIISYLAIIDAPILLTNNISKSFKQSSFPQAFIFGTASSAYQYEGAENVGGRGPSIWDNSTHKYPGAFDTAHAAARAYDRSAINMHGVEVDINFNIEDYEEDFKQVSHGVLDVFQVMLQISHRVFHAETTWRLVGLISCYALSPSFNRLIGKRTAFKFFLVLMIISVYSLFFYDRAANGKPEILSIVSNAAFALVSLSWPKLISFGFGIGVFSYFIGCTINWMLIFVAIVFGNADFGSKVNESFGGDSKSLSLSIANALWRLVGVVSSVVGLLCYALSPSFNRLIGRWNILKFSLYGVFSLAIFTTVLFVKQFSPSTRYAHIKTYTSFVVLMIISVYSFYYDKALNGKPEILSIVSNAAFALMSLSLSKLIKFGFEIGIFAYFLGCLVVQLWTINWMLILVAVLFGCPLFVMHSSSDSQEDFDNRDQIIDESSGSDPEVGNAGQQDVGNESKVIIDSYPDSQEELSCEGQVIHSSSDTIPEVASSGDDQQLDIILEANSVSVVES